MNFTVAKFKLQPFWQEKDRKEALKSFRDVFKRQAPLHGQGWVLFLFLLVSFFFFSFLAEIRYESFGRLPKHRAVYLPKQGEWKWCTGAPSDLQGGSCYLSCRLRVHEHIAKCTVWKHSALQMLPNRKMQSYFMFFCTITCFSPNASYTSAHRLKTAC